MCSELVLDPVSGFLVLFPPPLLSVGFPHADPVLPWCASTGLGGGLACGSPAEARSAQWGYNLGHQEAVAQCKARDGGS